MNLRRALIKLAYQNPTIRPDIIPLLKQAMVTQLHPTIEPSYGTPLDGMTKQKAARVINSILSKYTKGYFTDQSWKPVHDIMREMNQKELPFYLRDAEYTHSSTGVPNGKVWVAEVPFINDKNRPTWLFGRVTASGAGSVEDPLEKYDLMAYVS